MGKIEASCVRVK